MHFALIAGEASGDLLGGALIPALRARFPDAPVSVASPVPECGAAGCESLASIDRLSVMGIAEVLPKLPDLFRLRAELVERLSAERPDVVIGIDAPDFNLGLEWRLREQGLKTVQMVSPTVWAWRQGRVKTIAKAVDLVLCLFPFEPKFYLGHGVKAVYIGHPLAEELADPLPQADARARLGHCRTRGRCWRCCRAAAAASWRGWPCRSRRPPRGWSPSCRACASSRRSPSLPLRPVMENAIAAHAPGLDWRLVDGQSREAMRAADAVLLASGTATLECLLLDRPMVVAYRGSLLTYFLLSTLGMLKIKPCQPAEPAGGRSRWCRNTCRTLLSPSVMAEALRALIQDQRGARSPAGAVRCGARGAAPQCRTQASAEAIAAS